MALTAWIILLILGTAPGALRAQSIVGLDGSAPTTPVDIVRSLRDAWGLPSDESMEAASSTAVGTDAEPRGTAAGLESPATIIEQIRQSVKLLAKRLPEEAQIVALKKAAIKAETDLGAVVEGQESEKPTDDVREAARAVLSDYVGTLEALLAIR